MNIYQWQAPLHANCMEISFTCSIISSGETNIKRECYWTVYIRLIYNSTELHHTHILRYIVEGPFQTNHGNCRNSIMYKAK